ncbi:magnesium chelatase [Sphaerisporangium melleum]|uniref:Mg-protoporphyrin IX chelatase n=1 Tax=Sphaerisporangium melleum TaxID=321316 RepID=A0A917VTP1_9ACTN|nr:VWA domain-containing protein [Sphaerisporangium melleum]GGL13112.1 magnesium chelatase [Sphaerisporangium melleum]GII69538.1 magnesium chelatase [Sphaerisporangium melleum]
MPDRPTTAVRHTPQAARPAEPAGSAGVAHYPFTAVVGHDDLKLALILNAVSPRTGGVLVRGEKGTAKSTIVRALAALLPPVAVVARCRFSCDPAAPDPGCPDGPHHLDGPHHSEGPRSVDGPRAQDGPHDSDVPRSQDGPRFQDGPRSLEGSRDEASAVVRPARLVELPVGASEDRLAGALDLERALTEGVKAFEPGLLAAAHRGVLYVDEVNLLHDHLVDLLLDAAALGTCYVERDTVSVRHAARFLLVGTMNPEEGELRPQLLDRFGLTVEVVASRDPAERAEVVRRRLAFEDDPDGFVRRWREEERALAARIAEARARLARIQLPDAALRTIATVCAGLGVDGMRADLITAHAAAAHAAWRGDIRVTEEDIRQAARLALPHRRRRDPFDAPGLNEDELDDLLRDAASGLDDDPDPGPPGGGQDGSEAVPGTSSDRGTDADRRQDPLPESTVPHGRASGQGRDRSQADDDLHHGPERDRGRDHEQGREQDPGRVQQDGTGQGQDVRPGAAAAPNGAAADVPGQPAAPPGDPYRVRALTVPGLGTGAPGRRSRARTSHGRVTGARVPSGRPGVPHLTATVRAAAPYQRERGRTGPGLVIRRADVREAVREGREGNLVLFVVDASGSMAARRRMGAVKGAVLSLLLDAYQRRDKIGLVTFRGAGAELVLPPTSSVEAGAARLRDLPTGGRTPLAEGLRRAAGVVRAERLRDPSRRPLLVVVTDGRATAGTEGDVRRAAAPLRGVAAVVVDCETGPVRLGLAARLAALLRGESVHLADLAAGGLRDLVRERRKAA